MTGTVDRLAMLRQSVFQRLEAERSFHRNRHATRQRSARCPVEHGREINEAARYRNVRDVPTAEPWFGCVISLSRNRVRRVRNRRAG